MGIGKCVPLGGALLSPDVKRLYTTEVSGTDVFSVDTWNVDTQKKTLTTPVAELIDANYFLNISNDGQLLSVGVGGPNPGSVLLNTASLTIDA